MYLESPVVSEILRKVVAVLVAVTDCCLGFLRSDFGDLFILFSCFLKSSPDVSLSLSAKLPVLLCSGPQGTQRAVARLLCLP